MSRSLPERVAGLYYAHGLCCSSHPITVISLAVSIILLCCSPLVNLPMPGVAPKIVVNNSMGPINGSESPALYIQQVVLRTAVIPWDKDLSLSDAFRGPLFEVFNLLEIIQNYENTESLKSLAQVCLHIEAIKKRNVKKLEVLPEYNCLVLSPANLWQQSIEAFNQDTNLIGTVFSYQNIQKGKISTAEMLFGMSLKETGVKRYPLRIRQRILQYAVTIFLKEYDPVFIKGLRQRLQALYPLHQSYDNNDSFSIPIDETLHIFYPGEFNYSDFFPLTMTFVALFVYVYFSVRKIELIKSKVGMAFSATVTVIASLSMSVGLCFFFGLTLSLSGKEVFPYLVVIVGLENVLVLTKSVVSTPAHLDVKIRVAQGLSKEGWSITKNLLTEVTILTIGLFTFVPAIQKFCIFAIVGLLNDFFLQMVLFSTTLAIDIRRKEMSTQNSKFHLKNIPPLRKQQFITKISNKKPNIFRSKSHPRLNGMIPANGPTNVIAPNNQNTLTLVKIPKRLRLVHFWARTRIFQRAFMVWMVVWISMIIYNSGIIEHVIHLGETLKSETDIEGYTIERPQSIDNYIKMNTVKSIVAVPTTSPPSSLNKQNNQLSNNLTEELNKLRPVDFPPWNRLSLYHWSSILSLYNVSMAGERITILPTIKLSHAVGPLSVRQISNTNDVQQFHWQSFATAALDPLDFSDMEVPIRSESRSFNTDTPFIPSTPMEIFLAAVLCLISVVVVVYTMVVLYRCICSRNYAEWRASWSSSQEKNSHDSATQLVLEAVPLVLEGHMQEIECITTDGNTVASSCLMGHIRVWDSLSGEQLAHIDRKRFFSNSHNEGVQLLRDQDELMSDYESGSPPSRGEMESSTSLGMYSSIPSMHKRICSPSASISMLNRINDINSPLSTKRYSIGSNNLDYEYQISEGTDRRRFVRRSLDQTFDFPDLRPSINTKFTSNNFISNSLQQKNYKCGFDFGDQYKQIFNEHRKSTIGSGEMCSAPNNEGLSNSLPKLGLINDLTDSANSLSTDKTLQIKYEVSSIWCMDYQENLIVIGCANGSLEFWEGTTGKFKCLFDDGSGVGISAVKFVGNRVVVAKLNGSVDFLQLESYSEGQQIDWGFTSYRRTHVRTGSAGSPMDLNNIMQSEEDMRCMKIGSHRAHQQAITVLDSEGGRVLTGSQDHTLKVYRLEDQLPLYTLHGHCGPISCLFIDRISPMTSGSGSQDGLLCVWDLSTGTCVYSIQAHDGAVAAITCSASYVVSIGADEKLCVWERFQGHLLHALPAHRAAYSLQLAMLTHHLLITSSQGSLIVWDVRTGEPIREVRLGHKDSCIFVKQMLPLRDSIVCDFGRQLRIVRFPLVSDKID
ncbi:PREDICTED: sterol regulatory element-binding protein cleavage-activating protein [Ceratosolen solmsi marchali]|uniref:Sterol regulatory element-binding protein cleavage-activating protein n=1 Tax=Ceratosolen solmsi marchali TaxID=326594 RepID=A0AAJ6VK63_9HYME|nr:PREDICTED: sterol regulatory element-binding protein cleavage-activating protein [Ceratosolen solmsi marchali]XP_011494741.1 PREDICTED: sterol regulatory element-binding protein cleavage-activating protein [Ceratosolen solmsi marchali]XP_011494742.1 PREDICTED: sterol regulatory element-binding protein cleavage-activating protein [Ceratosolen solmsi marchali]XP_011494743.1 PREDICTED: sterol regulatory element-binding protein cleavage-activating protein [Ceratosolen solmsi marchali]XP_01149474